MLANLLFFIPILSLVFYNIFSRKKRKVKIHELLNIEKNEVNHKKPKIESFYINFGEVLILIGKSKLAFYIFLSAFYIGFTIFIWFAFKIPYYVLFVVMLIEFYVIYKAFKSIIANAYNDYFENNFPNVLKFISRNLSAGLTIYATIKIVSTSHKGLIGKEFTRMAELLNNGVSLTDVMDYGEKIYPYKGYLIFSYYLKYSVTAGSKLSDVLSTLSQDMKDAIALKHKVRVMTSEVRSASYILASLSFIMIGLTYFLNERNFYFLINSQVGNAILAYVVISISVGIMLSNKLISNVKV